MEIKNFKVNPSGKVKAKKLIKQIKKHMANKPTDSK